MRTETVGRNGSSIPSCTHAIIETCMDPADMPIEDLSVVLVASMHSVEMDSGY